MLVIAEPLKLSNIPLSETSAQPNAIRLRPFCQNVARLRLNAMTPDLNLGTFFIAEVTSLNTKREKIDA